MFMPSAIGREMIADPGQIKSAWLGAEARVHLAQRTLPGNRFMLWSRGLPVPILIFRFFPDSQLADTYRSSLVASLEAVTDASDMAKEVNLSESQGR